MLKKNLMLQYHTRNILCGLRISGMALSNLSDLPEFFRPRKVNLKIGQILEDDSPRTATSRKMTCRERPNPGLPQAGISKEDLRKPAA